MKVYWHPETLFYGHPYITDNSYIFPKLTREIWTQVNTENGLLCPESPTFIYGQLLICRTLIIYALSPFFTINVCHNYVLIVDTVPCSNNDRFQRVNITVFLKKTVANQREKFGQFVFCQCLTCMYCSSSIAESSLRSLTTGFH